MTARPVEAYSTIGLDREGAVPPTRAWAHRARPAKVILLGTSKRRWIAAGLLLVCILLVVQALGTAAAAAKRIPPGLAKKAPQPPADEPAPPPANAEACAGNRAATGPGTVVITFDDGLRTQLSAATVLGERSYCGTFYVVASYLRDGGYYADYLSSVEVAALSAAGQDVQSHTVTHPDLTTLTSAQLSYELTESKAKLEMITGKPVTHLAYPYGASDLYVRTTAALSYTSGRLYQSSLEDGPIGISDRYAVPSLGVERWTSIEQAKGYVDYAIAHNTTVVLSFHSLRDDPGLYDWTLPQFQALVAHIALTGVKVRTMDQLAAEGGLPG